MPHKPEDEHYLCISSGRTGLSVLFSSAGGVDVGDVDSHGKRLVVRTGGQAGFGNIPDDFLAELPQERRECVSNLIISLISSVDQLHCSFVEFNPLVVVQETSGSHQIHLCDMVRCKVAFVRVQLNLRSGGPY